MKEVLLKYLSNHSSLTKEEKKSILDSFTEKSISKNDFWIRQNETCQDVAFVCEGILRVFHEVNADEITLQFVFPESFAASLSSLAYNRPGSFSYQALTDCELLIIRKDSFHDIMFRYAKKFNVQDNHFLKSYTDLESRLLSQLHLSAEERFNQLFSGHPEIFNLVPLKHIATSLGMTPETLSRLRKKHLN